LRCISSKNNAYFVFKGEEQDIEEFKHKLKISSMIWQPTQERLHFSFFHHDSSAPT